jgi:predicted 2-oxoglutarate/Fe(II)-dependent dioxygenase YbiX
MLLHRQAFVSGAVVFAFVLWCCCFVTAAEGDFTLFKIEEATTRGTPPNSYIFYLFSIYQWNLLRDWSATQ